MRKILVSAFGCWPGRGSELGVGWEWCKQMAAYNNLHIITIRRSKEDINAACEKIDSRIVKNMTFHYFDYSPYMIKMLPAGTSRWYLYYALWQLAAYKIAKRLKKDNNFDYVMHLTFGSVWLPTFMWKLGVPFIWGPWGGCDIIPKSFLTGHPRKGGNILGWMQQKREWLVKHISWNPLIKANLKNACAILVRTQGCYNAVPQQYRYKTHIVLETAIALPPPLTHINHSSTIRILYTGRLIIGKNLLMAIKAVASLSDDHNVVFDIIGDGPEKENLNGLISILNKKDCIHILQPLQRDDLLEKITQYDIYLFPSLLEGGSWALMEALGSGLPTVCFNASGMRVITDDSCAIRIPMDNPQNALKNMTNALKKLCMDSSLRKQMGENAARRIRDKFSWDGKGIFMEKLLQELDNNAKTR